MSLIEARRGRRSHGVLGGLILLAASAWTNGGEPPVLRIGGDRDFPPFSFLENGEPRGLDAEIAGEVARAMGCRPDFVLEDWSNAVERLRRGDVQVLMSVTPTVEREAFADFSVPYLSFGSCFAVPLHSGIRTASDLRERAVAVLNAGVLADWLATTNLAGRIVRAGSDPAALRMALDGAADAALVGRMSVLQLERQRRQRLFRELPGEMPMVDSCLAVAEGDTRLLGRINEGITELRTRGTLTATRARWLSVLEGDLSHRVPAWLWPASVGTGILVLLALAWVLTLRRAVAEKRTELERELRRRLDAEEEHRKLVEQIPAVVYRVDLQPEPHTIFVSPQLHAFLGFTPDQWINDPGLWIRQVEPADRERVLAEVQARNRSGESFDLEYRALHASGAVVWMRNQAVYDRDRDGRPRFVNGVMMDISRAKNAELALETTEEKLRLSQKMDALGRLAGGVAHDLNNLLTPILGYSRLLHERTDLPAEALADLDEVIHAGERAADLTRQLLAFGRRQMVSVKPLRIDRVVADTEALLSRTLGEDIEIETSFAEDPGFVRADAGQIAQIAMNLVVNARDAMPQGGSIRIRTARVPVDAIPEPLRPASDTGYAVELVVRDTGCGMSEDIKSRIFEPFFTTKDPQRNNGLGLSTVYGIVARFGGRIDVESAPGAGTEFRIWFPEYAGDDTAEEPPEDRTLPRGTETVLLVEDEHGVRRLTARLLRSLGYRVVEAGGGADAIAAVNRENIALDLLLTDVVMPHMSGIEVARALRKDRPGLRVLFVTGFSPEEIPGHGSLTADSPVLLKPFSQSALALKIRQVLASPPAKIG